MCGGDGQVRAFVNETLWWAEERFVVGGVDHGQIVVGIARRKSLEIEGLKGFHRFAFMIGQAEFVVGQAAGCIGHEVVAEKGRIAQLGHEGTGKLTKGIGQDDEPRLRGDPFDEFPGTRQWIKGADHVLYISQCKTFPIKNIEAFAHEGMVAGLVTRCMLQCFDAGFFSKCDPDFGDQYPLKVEADDIHAR